MTAGPYSIGSDHWPGVSKLVEEIGELGQVLGKLMATNGDELHWDGSNLRVRLIEELGDVYGAIWFLDEVNQLDHAGVMARAEQKLLTFRRWHEDQRVAS